MSIITERDFEARPADAVRRARQDGELVIRCEDGSQLTLKLTQPPAATGKRHPLDVGVVAGLNMTADEIVEMIHEARDEYDREKEKNCRRS